MALIIGLYYRLFPISFSFFPFGSLETDVDSGVDENTQQGDGSPKTGSGGTTASRIPRKTPPESPVKNRSRRPRPDGAPNFPRSKSVPKPFTGIFSIPPSTSESVTLKKGRKEKKSSFSILNEYYFFCSYYSTLPYLILMIMIMIFGLAVT